MAKYQRILLATDFSERASVAQAEALRLARRDAAELHIVHVEVVALQGAGLFSDPPLLDPVHEPRPGTHDVDYGRAVFKTVRDSSEAAGILRYAQESGIDLIVVGTHGRSAISEALMGSVAQELARAAPVSVLVVGGTPAAQGRCVFAPVDFSEAGIAALERAARVAAEEQLPLVAFHAVNFNRVEHPEEFDIGERERIAREELAQFVAKAKLPVTPETQVSIGSAADEITRIAADRGAALIVMPASRHTTLERLLLLGSVTKPVIRHAPCPVLIYRAPLARVPVAAEATAPERAAA